MPDPDIEESQIVEPDVEFPPYSSPPLSDVDENVRQLPDTQIGVKETQQAYSNDTAIESNSLETGQDSYTSRVDETQYVSIEPETQSLHDSLGSKVPETQFENLERDTQAFETQPQPLPNSTFSPDTDEYLPHAEAIKPLPPPIGNEALSSVTVPIKKPEIVDSDPTEGFRFGKPGPVVGNYTHIRQKNVDKTPKPTLPQDNTPIHPISKPQVTEPTPPEMSAAAQQDLHTQSLRHNEPPNSVRTLNNSAPHTGQPAESRQNPPPQGEPSSFGLHQLHAPAISTESRVPGPIQQTKECTDQTPLKRDTPSKPVGLQMVSQSIPGTPVSRTLFRPTNKKWIKAPFPDVQRTSSNLRSQRKASNSTKDITEPSKVPKSRVSSVPFPESLPNVRQARPPIIPVDHNNPTIDRTSSMGQRTQQATCNEPNLTDNTHLRENSEMAPRNQSLPHTILDATTKYQNQGADAVARSNANTPQQHRLDLQQNSLQAENARHSSAVAYNVPLQPPPRGSSQTPTGVRPQSARSNISTPMSRPLSQCQLEPRGILEHNVLGPKHTTRVHKLHENQRCEAPQTSTATAIVTQQAESISFPQVFTPVRVSGNKQPLTPSSFGVLIAKMYEYESMLRDHNSRMELVESQQQEIKKLNDLGEERKKRIEALEVEKKDLSQKLKKYGTFHAQYKDHMNKVVISQRLLLDEAKEMQQISAKAIEVYSTHQQQSVVDQMTLKIREIKKMRSDADQLVKADKTLLARVAAAEETAQKFKEDAMAKQKVEVKLKDSLRTNDLLKKDLEKNLIELSRAQHNSDQLHTQLTKQLEAHKELMKLLKDVPSDVFKQFPKDEGALAQLLALETTTQTKLEEAMCLFKELKSHEAQAPSSLIKLIEDMCVRIESKLQTSDNNGKSVQESLNKLLEDFKERVVQLNADTETQNGLRDRISELRECNVTLAAEKTAHELELQHLSNQLQESQRDLSNCRGQLASKSEQLTALQTLPKEDPRLVAKVQDLENANSNLISQLNNANEDIARTKEELKLARESVSSTTENMRSLEDDLKHAQARIDAFDEEKNKYEDARKELVEKEAQKIAKLSESSTKAMQMKFDSKVNTLRQKFSEVEAELKTAKEDLQRAQNEIASSHANSETLRAKNASYKEQSLLQDALLRHLEEQCSGWEERDQRVHRELGSTACEIQELRSHLETTRTATCRDLETVFEGQTQIEQSLRKLESHQEERAQYQKQQSELKKKVETVEQVAQQKEALEKANSEKEEEVATLRKQLELATNSKVDVLVKEKGMLEQQNSSLQAQIASLQKSHYLAKDGLARNEPTHRDTTQQIQPSQRHKQKIGSQSSSSQPDFVTGSQEDDILIRGHIGNPKQMLRAAMKRDLNGRDQSTTTPKSFLEAQSDTHPRPSIPSSRRVSNRKSSNPYQSQQPGATPSNTQSTSKPSGSRAPSRRASSRRDNNLDPYGQNEDGEMLFSQISDPRFRAPPSRNSAIDQTSAASVASSAIKPFSSFTPFGESPLTDFEPVVDQMEFVNTQEQLDETYKRVRKDKAVTAKHVRDEHGDISRSEKVVPDSQQNLDRDPFKDQEFSDVDEIPIGPKVKKAKTKAPTVEQESSRRRASMPLKSALKNPQAGPVSNAPVTHGMSDDRPSSYFQSPVPVSVLQNKPSGTNKSQTRQPKVKGQNRMASGISANARAGTSSNTRQAVASSRTPSKQPADGTHVSPLPKLPAGAHKRSFEGVDTSGQRAKRVSLPPGASNRVIADSQGRR